MTRAKTHEEHVIYLCNGDKDGFIASINVICTNAQKKLRWHTAAAYSFCDNGMDMDPLISITPDSDNYKQLDMERWKTKLGATIRLDISRVKDLESLEGDILELMPDIIPYPVDNTTGYPIKIHW